MLIVNKKAVGVIEAKRPKWSWSDPFSWTVTDSQTIIVMCSGSLRWTSASGIEVGDLLSKFMGERYPARYDVP